MRTYTFRHVDGQESISSDLGYSSPYRGHGLTLIDAGVPGRVAGFRS